MKGDTPAKLVIDVLKQARAQFGPFTPDNQEQVTRWVRRRTEQLLRDPEAPRFDAKAAAVGEDQ